ncbi:MAG: putative addiction module antidote protein [Candidimonas sp.]|nr:MAG: putative addiction module antidote protein [Candidimonas sp.]
MKSKLKLIPFDMTAHLDSPEAIAEYLTQVLADGDADELLRALGYIAKARGMAQIAEETGLGRESLYKALAPGAKPRYDTILKVIRALGVRLSAQPVEQPTPVKAKPAKRAAVTA